MRRFVKFFSCLCFVVVFLFSFFCVGCGFDNSVNKASKNLSTYNLNVVFNEDSYTASCSEQVNFINNTGEVLTDICFHLYPRAFREDAMIKPYTSLTEARCFPNGKSEGNIQITKVVLDGKTPNYCLDGEDENILKLNLNTPLKSKEKLDIKIDFLLTIPNCTHRFGYYENNVNLGNFYPIVCMRENGNWNKTPYYATGDPFFSECANYVVNISAPNSYYVSATGNEEKSAQEGLLKRSEFSAKATRDFAIVLTKNAKEISSKEGNTAISVVGQKEDGSLNANLETAVKAFRFFNKTFGTYPYRTLRVVKTPFMQGGMEYPNLVMISSLISDTAETDKVIVHEIAHQWWYGVIGNNQINNAYIDEGLSEYSTFLFFDGHPEFGQTLENLVLDAEDSYNLYLEVFNSIGLNVNTQMDLAVNNYQSEYEYTYMVYVRGALMYNYLAKEFGQKETNSALKNLYKKYKFKVADKDALVSCFRNKAKAKIIVDNFLGGHCYLDKV